MCLRSSLTTLPILSCWIEWVFEWNAWKAPSALSLYILSMKDSQGAFGKERWWWILDSHHLSSTWVENCISLSTKFISSHLILYFFSIWDSLQYCRIKLFISAVTASYFKTELFNFQYVSRMEVQVAGKGPKHRQNRQTGRRWVIYCQKCTYRRGTGRWASKRATDRQAGRQADRSRFGQRGKNKPTRLATRMNWQRNNGTGLIFRGSSWWGKWRQVSWRLFQKAGSTNSESNPELWAEFLVPEQLIWVCSLCSKLRAIINGAPILWFAMATGEKKRSSSVSPLDVSTCSEKKATRWQRRENCCPSQCVWKSKFECSSLFI